MRCARSWLAGLVLALAGCAGPRDTPAAGHLEWQRLCAHMQAAPRTPVPTDAEPLDTARVRALQAAATAIRPAVVHIHTVVTDATRATGDTVPAARRSGGTGVIVGADGLIATAAHVVHSAQTVRVVLADGVSYPARAIAIDPHRDLAVVAIDAHGLPTLTPDTSATPRGTAVVALGCPAAAEAAMRFGQICDACASLQDQLDPSRARDFAHLIETTAALDPGFSGGPLLDEHGHLLGLHVAVRGQTPELCRGYAQPLDPAVLAELSTRVRGD